MVKTSFRGLLAGPGLDVWRQHTLLREHVHYENNSETQSVQVHYSGKQATIYFYGDNDELKPTITNTLTVNL